MGVAPMTGHLRLREERKEEEEEEEVDSVHAWLYTYAHNTPGRHCLLHRQRRREEWSMAHIPAQVSVSAERRRRRRRRRRRWRRKKKHPHRILRNSTQT